MIPTSATFDAANALHNKVPLYLVHFDGEAIDYCNFTPASPDNTCKEYLVDISGLSQRVTPEKGRASVGGARLSLLDVDGEILALFATDAYYFHRRKTTLKAGYVGMAEADLVTIITGWITDMILAQDGVTWQIEITDPMKWLQRKIFRGAEESPVTISGNLLTMLLEILTSTGAGTNGDYDCYAAENGLGIDVDYINVAGIEQVRDNWYPGDSHYGRFVIDERIKAKDFLEREIFQPLNAYPVVDGQGRFTVRPFKPPLPALQDIPTLMEDNIIGDPEWSANLTSLANEVEFYYDYDPDADEYGGEAYYYETDSINNRGGGSDPVTIKSRGFHTSFSPGSHIGRAVEIGQTRANRVFSRYAAPPVKLKLKTWFELWPIEAGDIVTITHPRVPDLATGARGITDQRMEIINRQVNWRQGIVEMELLHTQWTSGTFGTVSPHMSVISGASEAEFTVSAADAAKYAIFTLPEVIVCDQGMRIKASGITLLTINTTTGVVTCDAIGATPQAGWIIVFADYAACTAEQQCWGFVRSDRLVAP